MLADLGSKFINLTDEWLIDLATFKMIFNYFRLIPTVDCFASDSNFKCTKFFSKIPQLNTVGVNFFHAAIDFHGSILGVSAAEPSY